MTKQFEQNVVKNFPFKGLSVTDAFTQQPENTTAVGVNCRAYDPLQNRLRGGSRSGITKYTPVQVVPDTLIQELNIVPYLLASAIGSVNYTLGGLDQTTMQYPGSYLLGKQNADGSYGLSVIIGLDGNGELHVGVPIDGYPVGTDLVTLPADKQISLPSSYNVVAYWQPGAFPLSQGLWQIGDQFPGFGFFGNAFPGGFIDTNFGFPGADVPEFVAPSTPDFPFWNWNSGYEIVVHINIGVARSLIVAFLSSTDLYGLTINLNGVDIPTDRFTKHSVQSEADGFAEFGFYAVTDDPHPYPNQIVDKGYIGVPVDFLAPPSHLVHSGTDVALNALVPVPPRVYKKGDGESNKVTFTLRNNDSAGVVELLVFKIEGYFIFQQGWKHSVSYAPLSFIGPWSTIAGQPLLYCLPNTPEFTDPSSPSYDPTHVGVVTGSVIYPDV